MLDDIEIRLIEPSDSIEELTVLINRAYKQLADLGFKYVGTWQGEDLAHWVAAYRDSGELPSLQALVDDFWSSSDLVTYPAAGHFAAYLLDGWGVEALKRVYVAEDLEAALLDETGMDLESLEAAWLSTVPI